MVEEPIPAPALSVPADLPPAVCAVKAELYYWVRDQGLFAGEGEVQARLVKQGGPFDYWITATGQDGQVLAHRVSTEMNQRKSVPMTSLTWNNFNGSELTSWCIRFGSGEDMETFSNALTQAIWETLHQSPWAKAKVSSGDFVCSARYSRSVSVSPKSKRM